MQNANLMIVVQNVLYEYQLKNADRLKNLEDQNQRLHFLLAIFPDEVCSFENYIRTDFANFVESVKTDLPEKDILRFDRSVLILIRDYEKILFGEYIAVFTNRLFSL